MDLKIVVSKGSIYLEIHVSNCGFLFTLPHTFILKSSIVAEYSC